MGHFMVTSSTLSNKPSIAYIYTSIYSYNAVVYYDGITMTIACFVYLAVMSQTISLKCTESTVVCNRNDRK